MYEEEYDDEQNFERIALMHIKRKKYAIYKMCINNFKLNNSDIYESHKSSPIFDLKVNDLIVTPIEINIYILKNKIVDEAYNFWKSVILDSLKISNQSIKDSFEHDHGVKHIIKLSYPNPTESEVESDDELESENDSDGIHTAGNGKRINHFTNPFRKQLPFIQDNHQIGEFYNTFIKNRKSNNVFVLSNEDFKNSNENSVKASDEINMKKRKRRSELSIPLIELKESDMDDWSCPKFGNSEE